MTGAVAGVAALGVALAVDALWGDPPNRWHPVAWMGAALATGRRYLAHGAAPRLFIVGGLVTIGTACAAALAGAVVARAAAGLGVAGILVEGAALSCCLSVRGLRRAASSIERDLLAGDLPAARAALSFHLVSRDTTGLGPGEVASATIESVAENLADSVVAPALAYLAFGLPGAALYRAVNTADAMLGYRHGVLEHFGKVAARADDVLNLVPARLAGIAVVVAAAVTGASARGAARVMRRDHGRTASPNAGWTMAAMAGALGVRLSKRQTYTLGDGALPAAGDIARSLRVMVVAALLALAVAAGITLFVSGV